MAVDPNHLREATRRVELLRAQHQAQEAAWEERCRREVPELAALDAQIAQTVSRAIAAALQCGTDPAPVVEEARSRNLALQAKRRELLKAAGIDPESLEHTPYCPVCGDTGRHEGKLCGCVAALCAEENRKELARQLDLEALRFENFSLSWYSAAYDSEAGMSPRECMETVLGVCRDYAREFPRHPYRNLFLYGGTGLGKTFLSGCVANEVSQGGHWTVYETALTLLRRYEVAKFAGDAQAEEDTRRYENCELLVVDDLGSEMTTPFFQSALYQLLNQRILGGRNTVISSNLTMDDVRGRYTPQVASRLEGEYRGLPFLGEDIRLQRKG